MADQAQATPFPALLDRALEHRFELVAALAAVFAMVAFYFVKYQLPLLQAPFLDSSQFKPLKLTEIRTITHNTKLFRFALPGKGQRLGLPTGQHITFKGIDEEGKEFYRPYTPVSSDAQLGAVDFVIKLYPSGKMSQYLAKMQAGDELEMKGPRGRFKYEANMRRDIGGCPGPGCRRLARGRASGSRAAGWRGGRPYSAAGGANPALRSPGRQPGGAQPTPAASSTPPPPLPPRTGMLAGGSGITPMYQVLTTILSDSSDRTRVSLIFGNIAEQDILIREELDALAHKHPERFRLHYVLNQPPEGWKGGWRGCQAVPRAGKPRRAQRAAGRGRQGAGAAPRAGADRAAPLLPHPPPSTPAGGVGFVNEVMIRERLPAPGDGVMVLRCGPGPMNEAMKAVLDKLGYAEESQFQF
jgi:NAD(P)H-flavin reductase